MRSIRLAFFLVALVHGVFYAAVMPPWQAPDEVAHFEYSHLLATLGRPISQADDSIPLEQQIIRSLYQFHAWTYRNGQAPPDPLPQRLDQTAFGYYRTLDRFSLAYVFYAAAAWPFLNQDIVVQLFAMRLASVVMGALVIVLAFETARLVVPDQPGFAVAVAGFVLFLPQHAFITSSVSDGNLAELGSSACIFSIVLLWRRGLRWTPAAAGVACAVAAILSKATAYFLLGLILVMGPALVLRSQPRQANQPQRSWRNFALGGLVVGGLGAMLLPAILFMPPLHYIRNMLTANAAKLQNFGPYVLGLNADGQFSNALAGTFNSFWVTFGWMAVSMPLPVYLALLAVTAVAMIGLVWRLRGLRASADQQNPLFSVLGLAAALAIAVLVTWFVTSPNGTNYFQGRYVFGAIIPIACLLVAGWLAFVPARFQSRGALLILIVMVLFDSAAIFTLAWPYFYRAGLA